MKNTKSAVKLGRPKKKKKSAADRLFETAQETSRIKEQEQQSQLVLATMADLAGHDPDKYIEALKTITILDDRQSYKKLHNPRNREELWEAIRIISGYEIPWKAATPGNQAPFEYVASVFFREDPFSICMGPRTGGKTLIVALTDYTTLRFGGGPGDPVEITHAAAETHQAVQLKKYIEQFIGRERMRYEVSVVTNERLQVTQKKVRLDNGNIWYIISGTPQGVNSHHPEIASFDEIEWWPLEALDQSWYCPVGRGGRGPVWTGTSTRQRPGGAMYQLVKSVEDATDEKGMRLFKFDIFDVMQRCVTCKAIDEHPHGTDAQRKKSCALWDYCHGQIGINSRGFKPRSEVEHALKAAPHKFEVQMLCRKPDTGNSILAPFVNKYDYNDGGHEATGFKFDKSLPWYLWHDPAEGKLSVGLFVQVLEGTIVIFNMLAVQCSTVSEFKKEFHKLWHDKLNLPPPASVVVDPHRPDAVVDWKAGTKYYSDPQFMSYKAESPKMPRGENNTEIMITLGRVIEFFSNRRIFYEPVACAEFIDKGVDVYSYKQDKSGNITEYVPTKAGSDYIDPLRYGVVWVDSNKERFSSKKKAG